jgi:hypothetical protein
MGTAKLYSKEVRKLALRLVLEHRGEHRSQWAGILSVSAKIACGVMSLHRWVVQAEGDHGVRGGPSTTAREQLRAL